MIEPEMPANVLCPWFCDSGDRSDAETDEDMDDSEDRSNEESDGEEVDEDQSKKFKCDNCLEKKCKI